ncbi:MAG: hypothetical protein ACFE0P_02760 [Oceanicaulis sp.]
MFLAFLVQDVFAFAAPADGDIVARLTAYDSRLFAECAQQDRTVSPVGERSPASAAMRSMRGVQFPPMTFMYMQTYEVSGCGRAARRYEAESVDVSYMPILTTFGPPGETRIEPAHLLDLRGPITVGILQLAERDSCTRRNDPLVLHTRFAGDAEIAEAERHAAGKTPSGMSIEKAWREVWTVSHCPGESGELDILAMRSGPGLGAVVTARDPAEP